MEDKEVQLKGWFPTERPIVTTLTISIRYVGSCLVCYFTGSFKERFSSVPKCASHCNYSSKIYWLCLLMAATWSSNHYVETMTTFKLSKSFLDIKEDFKLRKESNFTFLETEKPR